jgi:hypothetical protein
MHRDNEEDGPHLEGGGDKHKTGETDQGVTPTDFLIFLHSPRGSQNFCSPDSFEAHCNLPLFFRNTIKQYKTMSIPLSLRFLVSVQVVIYALRKVVFVFTHIKTGRLQTLNSASLSRQTGCLTKCTHNIPVFQP